MLIHPFSNNQWIFFQFFQKFNRNVREEDIHVTPENSTKFYKTTLSTSLQDLVKDLLDQVEAQQTTVYQASKALNLCNSIREFVSGPERIESERLLLLANLRKIAYLEQIKYLVSHRNDMPRNMTDTGDVTITDLSLALKKASARLERQNGDFVEWFVIVIAHGTTVWSTQAVACPITTSRIYFPGAAVLPELKPNFVITISVYSINLPNSKFTHDVKYHLTDKGEGCIYNPGTLLRAKIAQKTRQSRAFDVKNSGVKETSFTLCGYLEVVNHDLNLRSPWPLHKVRIVGKKDKFYMTFDLKIIKIKAENYFFDKLISTLTRNNFLSIMYIFMLKMIHSSGN